MTKGVKCDGPDCNRFVVGEPIGPEGWWLRLEKLNCGEYSYHFHNLDCLINWAILEKEHEEGDIEFPARKSTDKVELIDLPDPPTGVKRITPDIVPTDFGGLAQKAQPPPKEDEVPELPPSDEGELLEMNDPGT